VKSSSRVYLEAYTSILMVQKERLVRSFSAAFVLLTDDVLCKEAFYGKDLILADRDMVETESDEILRDADTQNVSLLVVGDPFG
jgi:diphthine synthase